MKVSLLLAVLLFSMSTLAQPFIMDGKTRSADLNNCQKNHNIILDKSLSVVDSQIGRLVTGIVEEERAYTHKSLISAYKSLLGNLVVKRIILQELKQQLNSRNLHQFYMTKGNYNKDFLNPDTITVDLEKEFKTTLKAVLYTQGMMLRENIIDNIKKGVLEDIGKLIISQKFRQVGAGIFAKIVAGQAINVSGKAIGKVTLSFGSKLFVSAVKGTLLSLVVMPLQAYRLPPETLWTDLLEDYPELIMVPEWMRKGGISDHPWFSHCNAIQRRTKHMSEALTNVLKAEEKDFISRVSHIHHLRDMFNQPKDSRRDPPRAVVDNTYVHRPVLRIEEFPPFWAVKKK